MLHITPFDTLYDYIAILYDTILYYTQLYYLIPCIGVESAPSFRASRATLDRIVSASAGPRVHIRASTYIRVPAYVYGRTCVHT